MEDNEKTALYEQIVEFLTKQGWEAPNNEHSTYRLTRSIADRTVIINGQNIEQKRDICIDITPLGKGAEILPNDDEIELQGFSISSTEGINTDIWVESLRDFISYFSQH